MGPVAQGSGFEPETLVLETRMLPLTPSLRVGVAGVEPAPTGL